MGPRRFRMVVLGLALLVVSCKGGRPPVYPVRGQVLFEGKPTPDALVMFRPLGAWEEGVPWPVARAGPDGRFAPTTYGNDDGAPAGRYAVTITWVKEQDNQNVAKEDQREPRNLLPDRYSRPETSGFVVEVQKGPNELAPFRLTRK